MHPSDVNTIRNAQAGAWVRVRTPFGETAQIEVLRGTPQGYCLSPSLFVFFINLCLRHLSAAGQGFEHACGIRRSHTAFADDVALTAGSLQHMQNLLDRINEFCAWSGMEMCVLK
eukprot:909480-Rhodomonas_salina.1